MASPFPIAPAAPQWEPTKTRLTPTLSTRWANGCTTHAWRAPRTIAALRRDPAVEQAIAEGAVFLSVPLVIEAGRPVKANISLDRGLLDAIDAAARRTGLTRSGFLASAAREKIAASG